jgi:hypothetical protein
MIKLQQEDAFAEDCFQLPTIVRKRAASEVRSIRALLASTWEATENATKPAIHTPLLTVVDYRGFRVVVYAAMPLDDKVSHFKLSFLFGHG